jgi:hypothetical protein
MKVLISSSTTRGAGLKIFDGEPSDLGQPGAPLEIRFHLIDGSVESFVQTDGAAAVRLLEKIEPHRLFNNTRLIVADEYSKTVFVPAQVNRVDFVQAQYDCWHFPGGFSDMVELTEAEFRDRAYLDDPAQAEERDQPRPVGDLLVSFIELRFVGNTRVFVMVEGLVKLPTESHTFMNFLLSKRGAQVRLRSGGVAVLNLANLVRYSVYPGVKELPEDTWLLSRGSTS